jgi:hypothetical protein
VARQAPHRPYRIGGLLQFSNVQKIPYVILIFWSFWQKYVHRYVRLREPPSDKNKIAKLYYRNLAVLFEKLAEGQSFELWIRFHVYTISSRFRRLAATLTHQKELGITAFPGIARKREKPLSNRRVCTKVCTDISGSNPPISVKGDAYSALFSGFFPAPFHISLKVFHSHIGQQPFSLSRVIAASLRD